MIAMPFFMCVAFFRICLSSPKSGSNFVCDKFGAVGE